MIVRRFRESDAVAVSALIVRTLEISNAPDYPAEILEEVRGRQRPEDLLVRAAKTHFYVAAESGVPVGCGAIGICDDQPGESFLSTVFVLPERQGEGIGRKIVETLEADGYFLRAKRAELRASITALGFYRKLGYDFKNGETAPDGAGLYLLEKRR